MINLRNYIDHTLLKATATEKDIELLCKEAVDNRLFAVCVNPIYVKHAKKCIDGSDVKVCTVVGFPLGASSPAAIGFEARKAIEDGADEIDFVLAVGAFLSGNMSLVRDCIKSIVNEVNGQALIKMIIETCYLTNEQIIEACKLAVEFNLDFVKTSTGFGSGGATVEHVKLMAETVGDNCQVKASGGIGTYEDAISLINAGADRLGTSRTLTIINKESDK
ncbi:MAG: deoxyribose-phosphate aldolase [Tissierellia bacterium]|nr:deoxyribose-phosphate aldolase [Tissierellia bacterium]